MSAMMRSLRQGRQSGEAAKEMQPTACPEPAEGA